MQSLQAVAIENNPMPPLQHGEGLRRENLPFTVSLVQDEISLMKAVQMRQSAYERHVPELAKQLHKPDQYDYEPGTVVLLAESKMDGEPLGTMRIQTNRYRPLALEQSVTLPDWLQGKMLAEATRLGVARGRVGRLVKTTLFKAYYHYCLQVGIDWKVIAGRSPLDRQYEALLFNDVFPGEGFIPMQHAGNIPHRVLAFDVATAEPRWREANHPLYDFVFRTHHADIQVGVDNFVTDIEPGTGIQESGSPRHLQH